MSYYSTHVTAVGEEVGDLLDGGVLILYADGVPQALAEVSIQHAVQAEVYNYIPKVGHRIHLGNLSANITAVGDTVWHKVKELGHMVLSFNGAPIAQRPGELCVEPLDPGLLKQVLVKGCRISISN